MRWSTADAALSVVVVDEARQHAREGGARAAAFADWLARVELVRPGVVAPRRGKGRSAQEDEAMDEEELYGGSSEKDEGKEERAPGAGADEPQVVDPRETGAREGEPWEWVAEVDAKGDLRVCPFPPPPSLQSERLIAMSVADPPAALGRRDLCLVGRVALPRRA